MINPARKYKKRRRELFKALAWWEDEVENPDLSLDLDSTPGRRKILFEDRIRRRRASLESSVRRVVILASDWSTLGHVIQYYSAIGPADPPRAPARPRAKEVALEAS